MDSSSGHMAATRWSVAVALLENTEQQFGQALKVTRLDRKGLQRWPERDKWQSLHLMGQMSLLRLSYRTSNSFPEFCVLRSLLHNRTRYLEKDVGNARLPNPDLSHVENLASFCLRGVSQKSRSHLVSRSSKQLPQDRSGK